MRTMNTKYDAFRDMGAELEHQIALQESIQEEKKKSL